MPQLFYKNFMILVEVLHLLLSRKIPTNLLDTAEHNLKVFLQSFEKLYGDIPFFLFGPWWFPHLLILTVGLRYETLNFHLLLHLIACVRLYGPLWTVSCFPFETANGFLVRCISGTNSSMTNMLVTATCLSNVRLIRDIVSPAVGPFVQELLGDALLSKYSPCFTPFYSFLIATLLTPRREERVYGNVTAVGPFKSVGDPMVCFRAIIKGVLVESLGYERNPNRNNYTVELRDGRFGLVREFFVVGKELQARIEDLTVKDQTSGSITKYIVAGTQRTVPADDIVEGPLMTISCGDFISLIQHRPSPEAS